GLRIASGRCPGGFERCSDGTFPTGAVLSRRCSTRQPCTPVPAQSAYPCSLYCSMVGVLAQARVGPGVLRLPAQCPGLGKDEKPKAGRFQGTLAVAIPTALASSIR